jgi:hypothetical protein
MIGDETEVFVGGQHCQIMTYAQLSQQRIDRSDLHTISAAMISQFRRPDMIVAIWRQQRHRGKTIQNLIATLWPEETLKQFLKNEARGQKRFTAFDGADQHPDLAARSRRVAPERQRPDTCIDEETQSRDRPAL